ncbi:MAG: hypothetical protein ACFFFT_18775 [Candidatus Thorarchaeota archaeon]
MKRNITITLVILILTFSLAFSFILIINRNSNSEEEGEEGEIRINRANSRVILINQTRADVVLEVQNIGGSIVELDRFYTNIDTVENRFNNELIDYLNGSSLLNPGEKVEIYLQDSPASFYPIRIYNKIGVVTSMGISDEILFTASMQNYYLTIYNDDRISSPELAAASIDSNYRKHIPIDFNKTHAYTYSNGSTILNVNVKNTGDIIFGIESIFLTESLIEVELDDFYTKSGSMILGVNEEDFIIINTTRYADFNVNDEILICITGTFGGVPVTSDIGYIHTVRDEPDIKIIKSIENITTSFIYANETGKILIKNTGNTPMILDSIYINETAILNCSNNNEIEFIYGDANLDVQECAKVSFGIPGLSINESNELIVRITTYSSAQIAGIFYAN